MARLIQSKRSADTGQFEKTHSMVAWPEYSVWANMIHRCENPNAAQWPEYGGRGIRVCERWRMSFEAFLSDMGGRPSPEHSLDRIEVNGDYQPGNCRWATAKQQANNRRNTPRVAGLTPMEIAETTGLPYSTVKNRLRRGWTADRIMNQPRRTYPRAIKC